MTLAVRKMKKSDLSACMKIINHTISLGGTTAHEDIFDLSGFTEHYFEGPKVVNVALDHERIVGFQAVFDYEPFVYSIGSFTDQKLPFRGAGAALFAQTRDDCRALGGTSIIAKITSDNTAGLSYYAKMGFEPDSVRTADHVRPNGVTVDRMVKGYNL